MSGPLRRINKKKVWSPTGPDPSDALIKRKCGVPLSISLEALVKPEYK